MAHGAYVSRWIVKEDELGEIQAAEALIQLGSFYSLGYLLYDEDRQQAEQMYQRALAGREKAWGPDHTETLDTVNNLGHLYADLGKLEQAEQMLQRALAGYAKAVHPDNLLTYVPALNNMWAFAELRESQGRQEDAQHWYSQALLGYQKTFGQDHDKCQALRDNLAALVSEKEEEEGLGVMGWSPFSYVLGETSVQNHRIRVRVPTPGFCLSLRDVRTRRTEQRLDQRRSLFIRTPFRYKLSSR
jgi:tetratricopeptide (TPR) repeat protein